MRVALTCPYAWDAAGGVQVHVRQLASQLRERGHDVLVLAPGSRPPAEPWVRIVGRPVRVPYAGTIAPVCFTPASWRRVRTWLARFQPDVVHVHEPFTPSTSMAAVLASRVPVVATFHAFLERSRLLAATAPVLRSVWRRIAIPVAVSHAAAGFAARAFPGDYEVVPNGVDVALFRGAAPAEGLPEGRRVLWVNRLDPQKGFTVALRAFAELAADLPDASFIVAGNGPEGAAAARLPAWLAERVRMLGAVPHAELPRYHAASDAFVSPAIGQESFGIVLVEAMAAGVPVVATDIPGYREVVDDGVEGLLVPPGDPHALAGALRLVLDDPELAGRFAEAGRRRADTYSWDIVAPRLEDLYRRAVS